MPLTSRPPKPVHPTPDGTTELPSGGARARALSLLRQWITEGSLAHGQPIPGERELAAKLNVNRDTVRAALAMLSEEGLLRSNGGRLRIVHAPAPPRTPRLLRDAIVVLSHFPESAASVYPDIPGSLAEVTHGIFVALSEAQRHIISLQARHLTEADIKNLAEHDRPAGVIFADMVMPDESPARWAQIWRAAGVPLVLFGEAPELAAHDHVVPDHEQGAYELTRWLMDQGSRRPLLVWPELPPDANPLEVRWRQERRAGYERACREAGHPAPPTVLYPQSGHAGVSPETFQRQARVTAGFLMEHLRGETPADALLALNDVSFFTVAAAVRVCGLEPGRDIPITGYDAHWSQREERAMEPSHPAATVDKHNRDIGSAMASLLLSRIHGELPPDPQRRIVAPELVLPGQ